MSDDDAALWVGVRAGDESALGALFDRHEARLFRHAQHLLTTREDAKDAVAVAFFELWRKRNTVRVVDGSPLPWLLNTVSHSARNLERSGKRYRGLIARTPVVHHTAEPRANDETGVLAALKRLPAREQSVLVLTVLEGYPEKAAAETLGIPIGTVKSRLAGQGEAPRRDDRDGGIMGVKEDGLTPREHAEMRDLVLAGSQRIKPVGAHRNRFVAGAMALVLVGVLTVGAITTTALLGSESTAPVATPSPTVTATATPTPTPVTQTPTPPPTPPPGPEVVFGGDCGRLLSDEDAAGLLGSLAPEPALSAFTVDPDRQASAALLGGITCSWRPEDSGLMTISVYPLDAVSERVRESYASVRCGYSVLCYTGRQIGEFWVGVGVVPDQAAGRSPQAIAAVESTALGIIDRVTPVLADAVARPVPRDASWWTFSDCSALNTTVESVSGTPLEPGFPGDSFPEGLDWDVSVDAGLAQWCSWFAIAEGTATLLEVMVQPGIGSPTDEQVATGTQIEVAGADATWYIEDPRQPGDFTFVSVSGPNRILVRYLADTRPGMDVNAASEMVTAVLGQLR